ncbi:MAG: radical SAM/SPASM domain-containing protein [Candidatus Cloacimonadota bacterium]|nr:radical SAM/SPASM domain-containing protein [Candidatus Cloacimonadota bacterium]
MKKPIIWGYPPIVMIEPTNICNLRCPMCPSGNGSLKREKGYMDFSLFKKIIDEIKSHSLMIILWNQGEPFLNNDFLQMVKYASDAKLFTLVSTNANTNLDAENIVKSGLDSLIVSADGTTQEIYNKYRRNGNLEKVIDNVKKIVAAKNKLKSKHPLIRWQFIVMKHNEHQIEDMKKLGSSLGVDNLELKSAQVYSKEDINNFLPKNPKYRRYKIIGDDFEMKFGIKNRCRRIWTQPVVNWNGEAAVCCFDKDIDVKIGNIKSTSIKQMWQGKNYQNFRQKILLNRSSIPMCRNCGQGVKLKLKEKQVKKV